jgi:hypothetical protein
MKSIDDEVIQKIKKLRATGHSISEISKECRISPATASRYIRGVTIKKQHLKRWLERRNASKIMSERNWEKARETADALVNKLTRKELSLIGVSLYWAEGAKRDFTFSNTDPRMVRVFITILKDIFQISNDDFKISLRIYEDLNKKACLTYWSQITGVNLTTRKTSVDVLKGSKRGKRKYGMCRIRVRKSGLLLKKFSAIIDKIVEETRPS